jgi:hypothetical protein
VYPNFRGGGALHECCTTAQAAVISTVGFCCASLGKPYSCRRGAADADVTAVWVLVLMHLNQSW